MTDSTTLKKISQARLKSASTLINAKDWAGAVYMMAWALECALKARICKTLDLQKYPENTRDKKTDGYFMTHKFERLLIVSGLEGLFSTRGSILAYEHWSNFMKELNPDWPTMRYNEKQEWAENRVKGMYNNLVAP